MTERLHVIDEARSEYRVWDWSEIDPQFLTALLRRKDLMAVVEQHFGLDLKPLWEIEEWQDVDRVIACVEQFFNAIVPQQKETSKGSLSQ